MSEKALFWDFDGTLIHPNESFLCAMHNALESFQYKILTADIRKFLHRTCSWYKPEIAYEAAVGIKWWDALFEHFDVFYEQHGIAKKDRKEINKIFREYILDFRNYTLYDDAEEVLRTCKERGYDNYILSNNFPELPVIAECFGLSEYFTAYMISSKVGFEKPRAELFQYALQTAQYPKLCYMIGDNPIADIQGGKNAGMKTILVHNKMWSGAGECDFLCESLMDIIKVIL